MSNKLTPLELSILLNIRMDPYYSRGDHPASIDAAVQTLAKLGLVTLNAISDVLLTEMGEMHITQLCGTAFPTSETTWTSASGLPMCPPPPARQIEQQPPGARWFTRVCGECRKSYDSALLACPHCDLIPAP